MLRARADARAPARLPRPTALEAARAAGGGQAAVFATADERPGRRDALAGAHGDVIAALASALGERDRYTGDHSESVVDLAARVGESARARRRRAIARLRTAALLHDIGKVGVPDEILHKPGPLDEREWEIMRQHPVIGERILRAIPGMGAIARASATSTSAGTAAAIPTGSRASEIPIEARIILACDAYHAMVSDRPYRKAMSHSEAIAELTAQRRAPSSTRRSSRRWSATCTAAASRAWRPSERAGGLRLALRRVPAASRGPR